MTAKISLWFILILLELLLLFQSGRELQMRVYDRLGLWFFALLFLPATYIHEMSHFFLAQLLGIPSELGSFIPKRQDKQIILGSVSLGKTSLVKRFVVGIAPFAVGAILSFLLIWAYWQGYFPGWQKFLAIFLLFQSVNSMYLSQQDLKGIKGLAYLVLVLGLYLFYLYASDGSVDNYLQTAGKLILLPLGFNFGLGLILRYL